MKPKIASALILLAAQFVLPGAHAFPDRPIKQPEHIRAIESERARLSATLLQRGLFDRRAERTLGAQTAVLDEALARCRTRLHEIESSRQIVAEPARLAFALLRR